jgi:catechol 2,3-dioxygenase-like lactoylglutathione lyase family enzyme
VTRYQLASSTLYPGLFTDNIDKMKAYYDGRGLRFMELLRQSETYAELFFELPGSKLKIQSDSSRAMEPTTSGYVGLSIAGLDDGLDAPVSELDPDGLPVRSVPYGWSGITSLGFSVDVPDRRRYVEFLITGMPGHENEHGVRVGDTQFLLSETPERGRSTPICRRGFTYITLIVHDLVNVHRVLLDAGAEDSFGITRLHDRCVFSFVRDPFGNWIEVVQYANLSGPLPDVRRIEGHLDAVVTWREEAIPL